MKLKHIISAILVAIILGLPHAEARTYLVSVGVSDYPGDAMDLRLPETDATAMLELYKSNGNVDYKLLLNDEATTKNIKAAMDSLYSIAKPDDKIVFFFSGHGYPGGFRSYDGGFGYDQMRKSMAKSEATTKIVFTDACFSGKMNENGKTKSKKDAALANKYTIIQFVSSREDEPSFEYGDLKYGAFTTYLIEGLSGNADKDSDGVITLHELWRYLQKNLLKKSREKQHPQMYGRADSDTPIMVW